MIPVKWYIAIMIGAGVITFLYGVGTQSMNTILGSFLFTGIGGLVYFLYKRRV